MRDSGRGFPVIDFHCHFPVPDAGPPPAEEACRWRQGERKLAELQRNWRWYQEQRRDQYSFPYGRPAGRDRLDELGTAFACASCPDTSS